jgi:hypothetical protein
VALCCSSRRQKRCGEASWVVDKTCCSTSSCGCRCQNRKCSQSGSGSSTVRSPSRGNRCRDSAAEKVPSVPVKSARVESTLSKSEPVLDRFGVVPRIASWCWRYLCCSEGLGLGTSKPRLYRSKLGGLEVNWRGAETRPVGKVAFYSVVLTRVGW